LSTDEHSGSTFRDRRNLRIAQACAQIVYTPAEVMRMRNIIGNLAALLVATISFAVTIGVVLGMERAIDLNLFSLMWWGFIPVGAFVVGCLAASGYYVGAVKLNLKATRFVAVCLLLVTALVQVALYYSQYALAKTPDGQAISQFISFPRFLGWTLSHAKYGLVVNGYRPGGPDGGLEVGFMGYVIAFVQFLGLLVGGWLVYFILADKPYCEPCGKYLKPTTKVQLPFAGDMETVNALRHVAAPSSAYFGALAELPPGESAALELELSTCPKCSREALAERPMIRKDGKLAYQGDAYRTIWSAEMPLLQQLAALPVSAGRAAGAPPPVS
jgi:hypothetical protein